MNTEPETKLSSHGVDPIERMINTEKRLYDYSPVGTYVKSDSGVVFVTSGRNGVFLFSHVSKNGGRSGIMSNSGSKKEGVVEVLKLTGKIPIKELKLLLDYSGISVYDLKKMLDELESEGVIKEITFSNPIVELCTTPIPEPVPVAKLQSLMDALPLAKKPPVDFFEKYVATQYDPLKKKYQERYNPEYLKKKMAALEKTISEERILYETFATQWCNQFTQELKKCGDSPMIQIAIRETHSLKGKNTRVDIMKLAMDWFVILLLRKNYYVECSTILENVEGAFDKIYVGYTFKIYL